SLIFGIMRLINLAHGDLIVAATFLILALSAALGVNALISFAIAVPIMFLIGYSVQQFLLNRTLGENVLPPLLVTFGLSIVVQNGLLQGFSADSRRLSLAGLEGASIPLGGGLAVGVMPLFSFLAAVAVIL